VRYGVIAPPVTYMVDGEQYITLLVGWGGGRGLTSKKVDRIHPGTIYTFKLGGKAKAPEKLPSEGREITKLASEGGPLSIGNGYDLWTQYCVGCHAVGGGGGAHESQ